MDPVQLIGIKQLVFRLSMAAFVGGIIGLNRTLHDKPAGARTHALVTLGAAITTVLTLQSQTGSGGPDPGALGRIIQGILTGIGFLGAGVILRDTGGHVKGLATAATIWVCAALGIACGLGYWVVIATAVVIVFLLLLFGRSVERVTERIFRRHRDPSSGEEHNPF